MSALAHLDQGHVYEKLDQAALDSLRKDHAWIAEPIHRASEAVAAMPFYAWLDRIQSPQEFHNAAVNLYHHSATFPKVMGLMLATTPMSENPMMNFYAKHAYGEAPHYEMLMQWMMKFDILPHRDAILDVIPTIETNACINLAYPLALAADRDQWVLTINCGIERCSNDFFKAVARKMHQIGAGDIYFDIHVEADEFHSIMGLDHVTPQDPTSRRGRHLIAKSLEGIALWAAMLHSWIGLDYLPKFALDGTVLNPIRS